MKTDHAVTIVADSPAEALERVREKLGPHAVVLSVRSLPRAGLAKLWQRPRVEVRARGPEGSAASGGTMDRILATIRRLNRGMGEESGVGGQGAGVRSQESGIRSQESEVGGQKTGRSGGVGELGGPEELMAFGLLPEHARLFTQHGLDARDALMRAWRPAPKSDTKLHVFVGASGVGKTTVLCKWLAQVVLLGGESARVWRLDGRSANTAESLAVYAEILSVPIERSWSSAAADMDIGFVDVPGIDWRDESALKELGRLLDTLGEVQVHLVLNAAYESSILLQQVEAFGALPVSDLIMTHLDEESRWGKLWNLVLGSSHSLRFLSVGQNVPGTFQLAAPEHLL